MAILRWQKDDQGGGTAWLYSGGLLEHKWVFDPDLAPALGSPGLPEPFLELIREGGDVGEVEVAEP